MTKTQYIPSTLTSYFIDKLKEAPSVGIFKSFGERADVASYKVFGGDMSMAWILKSYNNSIHPYDGSFNVGSTLSIPSLNYIEKTYATLNAKQRALEETE